MKRISAALFFAAAALSASAQTNTATRSMSLQDCFAQALQHNFDVQIQQYTPQLSLYTLYSAYGGYDPTFNISGTHSYNVSPGGFTSQQIPIPATTAQGDSFSSSLIGTLPSGLAYDLSGTIDQRHFSSFTNFSENSGGNVGVTLNQPLLKNFWTDNTRLAISVAKNRLKYSEQTLRAQVITTVTAVENAYYEVIYARENVKVQQEALVLAQTQLDQDKQRVQVGSLAPLDVQQDEAQVAQSQASLIGAVATFGTDQRVLKNLITDQYKDWYDQDIDPSAQLEAVQQLFDVQDSWNKGMTQRPDLLQAKLDVEQQGFQLKYSFNQMFPELDLTGSYGYNGEGMVYHDSFAQIDQGNAPFYSYGAQLSIPLSNVSARNAYKSDKATAKQILLKLKQLEQSILVQIDNAIGVTRSDYEAVEANREARAYAEAALDAEQKKYAVGKSTTFTVLQLQSKVTLARSQEIRSLADYNEALATLAQQEGSTLERRQIDLKVK